MKKLIFTLSIVMFSLLGKAQAHLGSSFSDLKSMYPEKYFKIEYTTDGSKYTTAEQPLGTFIYYFDSENDLTYMCLQTPDNLQTLNQQIEIYNKKYVITSETTWKAYLEGGGKMNIELIYNEEYDTYIFYYTF
jgi:hypothetical protein